MRSRWSIQAAAAALLMSVGIGCSGDDAPLTDAPPDFLVELNPLAAEGWASVPLFQRELLADNDLTYAEYERAMQETVRCYKEKGFEIFSDLRYNAETAQIEVEFGGHESIFGGFPTVAAASTACESEYSDFVRNVWRELHEASPQDLAEAEALLDECVHEAGVEMPPFGSDEWGVWFNAGGLPQEFFDCVDEVARGTGVRVGA